eukprot:3730897-Alexandrium_andersonii.AAC.1
MSASLVGSEMCIRDSQRDFDWNHTRRIPPGIPMRAGSTHSEAWSQENEAVSYTHLTLPTICSV